MSLIWNGIDDSVICCEIIMTPVGLNSGEVYACVNSQIDNVLCITNIYLLVLLGWSKK